MKYYKPSKKGMKHFHSADRILVVDKTYVWFKEVTGSFYFDSGQWETTDVCEDKSHMRKCPDSFWIEAGQVDPSVIQYASTISDDNKREYGNLLAGMGIK